MLDTGLASAWLRALAPPPIVLPTTFAEREIVLPSSANARPGPLRLAPYQREPIDALADDDTDTLILQWASQTGKSTVVNAHVGYIIACDPGPALHVSPTGDLSKDFVKERLDPLISSSPALRDLVGTGQGTRKGSTGGTDSTSLKTFPGGSLSFASSYKPAELAARAIKYLLLDEVDRFAVSSPEGDPVSLALKRTRTFEGNGRRVLMVSTPTTRLGSRIDAQFKRGDQRRWFVTCPDCKHPAPIDFADLKWTPGKPETAHLVCSDCGVIHDEPARRAMVENGKWVATAKGEPGIRSYHLTELSSLFSTMASVAQQYDAAKTPEAKQVFYNTVLATTYDSATEFEVSSSELQQRATVTAPPYRADTLFVTAGVDCQGDRLECSFLAHYADQTCGVLDHFKLVGDTSGDAVWRQLDEAMGTSFATQDGRALSVIVQAIDSGFNVDQVLKYVQAQRRRSRSCYAIKGVSGFDQMPIRRGGRLRGQLGLMLVGVDAVKFALQSALTLSDPIAPGFIHLPAHLDDDYFAGLASEELKVKVVKGAPQYAYHRVIRRNEPFDCLVYATAIAKLVPPQTITQPIAALPTPKPDIGKLAQRIAALSN